MELNKATQRVKMEHPQCGQDTNEKMPKRVVVKEEIQDLQEQIEQNGIFAENCVAKVEELKQEEIDLGSFYCHATDEDSNFEDADLKKHSTVHESDKPAHACDTCGESLRFPGHLKERTKRYKCHICEKWFALKMSLKHHLIIHSGVKPYKCELCDREFFHKSNYNAHFLTHSNDKPFTCNVCDKSFATRRYLTIHSRVHTNKTTPYKCDKCDKQFAFKRNLKKHAAIHLRKPPHTCEQCNISFASGVSLKVHLAAHASKKPEKCDICNKTFAEWKYLRRHYLTVHARKKKIE